MSQARSTTDSSSSDAVTGAPPSNVAPPAVAPPKAAAPNDAAVLANNAASNAGAQNLPPQNGSAQVPPPPPPPVPPPTPVQRQAPVQPQPPAQSQAPAQSRSVTSGTVVPPPPPPRSTLPPVRPLEVASQRATPAPANGIGSAKSIRWRGELDRIGSTPTASVASEAESLPEDDEGPLESPTGRVVRSAPPWLVSMVIHLALLLILALVTTPVGDQIGRIVLNIGQSERETAPELAEFSIDAVDSQIDTDSDTDTISQVDLPSVFDVLEPMEISTIEPTEIGTIGGEQVQFSEPMFGGRTGAMKDALLKIYGGTPETQEAVALGLAWLKKQQRRDGTWSLVGPYDDGAYQENETAATAMAMLAFLGDGHTHRDGEYHVVVERGMKALVKMQDRGGYFASKVRQTHQQMYAQAQATIAICELYGMTKDSWLRPHAQAALDFAMRAQSPEGGWRYTPGIDSDTSVTGWFLMALKSGRSAGLEVDLSKMLRVNDYLDSAQLYDGAAYAYQPRSKATSSMTAEGLLCREYLGWQRSHPPLVEGLDALLDQSPFDINDADVYYWYYATQALHHFGGVKWEEWNRSMRVELPEAQIRRGNEIGSWAPQADQYGSFGRLYTTCLSIYCLEVYYRHLPLYKNEASQMHSGQP
ncbi:hypothetical protein Pla22_51190 [Rubripirellula amarantea]|uniref:Squalene cyclase C-terminal domain-containing protein n=1 Tax=Rubripirellula amarantea TaxID=2527999 RepID=A0A5C5WB85_9BACT|nr:prenyltransferase/squalene oxidase repeat-containing protein [Rubripirellula amarantea]TWT48118.1 hypothetical protein Pla22_51190 [Rubripirellula amarantea]